MKRTSEKIEFETESLKAMSLNEFIGTELSTVSAVECVFASRKGNVMQVCTVVNDFDPEVRAKIYDRETAIIDEFDSLEFDFDIVSRRGRDLAEVMDDRCFDFTYRRPPSN